MCCNLGLWPLHWYNHDTVAHSLSSAGWRSPQGKDIFSHIACPMGLPGSVPPIQLQQIQTAHVRLPSSGVGLWTGMNYHHHSCSVGDNLLSILPSPSYLKTPLHSPRTPFTTLSCLMCCQAKTYHFKPGRRLDPSQPSPLSSWHKRTKQAKRLDWVAQKSVILSYFMTKSKAHS